MSEHLLSECAFTVSYLLHIDEFRCYFLIFSGHFQCFIFVKFTTPFATSTKSLFFSQVPNATLENRCFVYVSNNLPMLYFGSYLYENTDLNMALSDRSVFLESYGSALVELFVSSTDSCFLRINFN